jgi:tetratricopeptide (TPR) repeat protein
MDTVLAVIAALLTMATPAYVQSAGRPTSAQLFESLSHQAEEARDAKRLEEALSLYKRALKLNPTWEDGWWNAGSIAYDLDKYPECAADFRRLRALKPEHAPAWTMEGICEYQLKDYNAALLSLTQVDRLKFEENGELAQAAGLHLALVLTKLGYFERALEMLFRLDHAEEKRPAIIAVTGIAGLRKRWTPPEVPQSDQDKVFKLGDAMATVMYRDYDAAIGKFEIALREYPKEPEIHYRFGAFLTGHHLDRGIQEIKKTLELEPDHLPALMALVKIYLKRNEPQTALPYAQQAAKLSPKDFATHVALGQVLLATGDAAGSAQELELAVKLAPYSSEAHYNLASAYSRMGRKADAVREREESKRLRESTGNQP